MRKALHTRLAFASLLSLAFLCACVSVLHAQPAGQGTAAGTKIRNRARGVYLTDQGETITTMSPVVEVTVIAVPAVVVSPDQTTPMGRLSPGDEVLRSFLICNSGNTRTRYVVTSAQTTEPAALGPFYFDLDGDGAISSADAEFVPGEALTPALRPGDCTTVHTYLKSGAAPVGARLESVLEARAEGDPQVRDTGRIIDAVGEGPRISSPDSRDMPPVKTVNGSARDTAVAGQVVEYAVTFRNFGAVDARGVRVEDPLPAGIEYVDNSLTLDGRLLTDRADSDEGSVEARVVRVRLARVAPDQVVRINFKARVAVASGSGTAIPNTASVAGDNFNAVATAAAVVAVDPFGIVYAARSGGSSRIGGARVVLLGGPDPATATPVAAPPGQGFTPNNANTNPFQTDTQGRYSFGLLPEQLGTASAPAVYYLSVTAPGYRARLIELALSPVGDGLFGARVSANDGQPLAEAGGFGLVAGPVSISSTADVGINVPMLEANALEISKEADRPAADIGELVTYRITVRNASLAPLNDVEVSDVLPASFHYAPGTGRLTRSGARPAEIEPRSAAGGVLLFQVGDMAGGESVVLSYRLRIGVGGGPGLRTNEARAAGRYPTGEKIQTEPARATVRVGAGIFSDRQVVVGRVFVDADGDGRPGKGEQGVPGVRLYLNNGQSVITDSEGLYNIPSLQAGAAVISVDPVTVPAGLLLGDGGRREGRNWARMLSTPLGGGGMLRQNFPLVPGPDYKAPAANGRPGPDSKKRAAVGAAVDTRDKAADAEAELRARALSDNKSGSYTVKASDAGVRVEPGEVAVLSPRDGEWSQTPALALSALVAKGWDVSLEVNGRPVSSQQTGERRVDNKFKTVTISFVGVSLKPGPNHVRVRAEGPGEGRTTELTVYASGPATRLEVTPERAELKAGGTDTVAVRVAAFDEWGHPAQDVPVVLETTAGFFDADSSHATLQEQSLFSQESSRAPASQTRVTTSGGVAVVRLRAAPAAGPARLKAGAGDMEALADIRFVPDVRPTVLVGMAQMSFGPGAPDMAAAGDDSRTRGHVSFFYRGGLGSRSLLTLAYDSARPLNRTGLGDRMFQLDPNERVYQVFGDSSTRFEEAQSNSKLYARLDRGRSYAMFGDMDAGLSAAGLVSYSRRLTGVAVHVENSRGDMLTVTGARPDTAFARDVFPAGNPVLYLLSHRDVLPGSESVSIEVRDRRNPEIIIAREPLTRSVDYQLDPASGQLFLLRQVSSLDFDFNLVQIVATYEHRADGLSSMVYTGRGLWNFGKRARVGAAYVGERRPEAGNFTLAGLDGEFALWDGGRVNVALALSAGTNPFGGNLFGDGMARHDGKALRVTAEQPLPFGGALLRGSYSKTSADFLNPYGPTVTPGSERAELSLQLSPARGTELRIGVAGERNRTERVSNERLTASALWTQAWSGRLRTRLGIDARRFEDEAGDRSVSSNLVTAGVEYRPTDKLQLAAKREQNLGEADPTYPNQTTLQATYQLSTETKLFFSQRLASEAITPISDVALTGFSGTNARRETEIGVETKYGKYTSLNGRYQIENGINGADSFAVVGLQNRIPIDEELSLDLQAEHGFHMAGRGGSFTSGGVGYSWTPGDDFRASARYELRERDGLSHLLTAGAAGRLDGGLTLLSQLQYGRTSLFGRDGRITNMTAAAAYRPAGEDHAGLLFGYARNRVEDADATGQAWRRYSSDTLSADGYLQPTRQIELYTRFALKLSGDGDQATPYVSTVTLLTQGRVLYRLGNAWDVALDTRWLYQPVTGSRQTAAAGELGYWVTPDLRVGGGYRLAGADALSRSGGTRLRRGFYFTVSSKISNLFDLFGTSKDGLAGEQTGKASGTADKVRGRE